MADQDTHSIIKYTELNNEIEKLKEEKQLIEELNKTHIMDLDKEIISLRKLLEEKETEVNNVKSTLEASTKLNKDLEDKISAIQASIEDRDKQIQEKETSFQASLQEKENQVNDVKSQIQDLENEISALKTTIGDKDKELDETKSKNGELKDKVESFQSILTVKNEELSGIKQKIIDTLEKNMNLENELKETSEKLSILPEKDKKIEELNGVINESKDQISELNQKIEELEEKIVELTPKEEDKVLSSGLKVKKAGVVPGMTTGETSCPNCSGRRIKHEQDRSKILTVAAGQPVYGKKFRCLDCGREWVT